MYTANIINRDVDKLNQNVVILVRFTEDADTFDKKFNFSPGITLDDIKRRIKQEIDRLEAVKTASNLVTNGDIDLTGITGETTQTQADLDRAAWVEDWNKLMSAQRLLDHGVVLNAAQNTAIANVRTRLGQNFKVEYLGLI